MEGPGKTRGQGARPLPSQAWLSLTIRGRVTGLLGVSAGSSHPEHLSVEYNVKSVHAFLLDLDTQQEMQFRGGEGSPDVWHSQG